MKPPASPHQNLKPSLFAAAALVCVASGTPEVNQSKAALAGSVVVVEILEILVV